MKKINAVVLMLVFFVSMLVPAMALPEGTINVVVHTYDADEDQLTVDTIYVYDQDNNEVVSKNPVTNMESFVLDPTDTGEYYHIVAEKNGYEDGFAPSFIITGTETSAIHWDVYLEEAEGPEEGNGYLTVTTNPSGAYVVACDEHDDISLLGTTPLEDYELEAGSYDLLLTFEEDLEEDENDIVIYDVEIVAGETTTIHREFDNYETGIVDIDPDYDSSVRPGEEVEMEITIENLADYKLEDVQVILEIEDMDLDENEDELESDYFDLYDDNDYEEVDFVFTVPYDAEEGEHQVRIEVEWDDENGVHTAVNEQDYVLKVKKEKHDIMISEVELSATTLKAGSSEEVAIELVNVGSSDEDDVKITVSNDDLGIDATLGIFELDEGEEIVQYVPFKIPQNTDSGKYFLKIVADYNNGKDTTSQLVVLDIEDDSFDYKDIQVIPTDLGDDDQAAKEALVGGLFIVIVALLAAIALIAGKVFTREEPVVVQPRRR